MSKISVIIPCYNAEKYIKKCFEGLEKQTFREFDVIVVDDFSTDNSLNILYEIKQNSKLKIKVIKMKQNVGPGEWVCGRIRAGCRGCCRPACAGRRWYI